MIKFILPAVILILIIIFWEKINEFLLSKFKIKLNYIAIIILVLILVLPNFLRSNSNIKQFISNFSIWIIIILVIFGLMYFLM